MLDPEAPVPQENVVTWDPEVHGLEFTWQTVLVGILLGAALLAYGKGLVWLVGRRAEARGWRATRYALPTALLLITAPAALVGDLYSGAVMDVLLGVVGCLNLAAIPGVLLALWATSGVGIEWTPPWSFPAIAALYWANWYLVVRCLEWRREMSAPTGLGLGGSSGGA